MQFTFSLLNNIFSKSIGNAFKGGLNSKKSIRYSFVFIFSLFILQFNNDVSAAIGWTTVTDTSCSRAWHVYTNGSIIKASPTLCGLTTEKGKDTFTVEKVSNVSSSTAGSVTMSVSGRVYVGVINLSGSSYSVDLYRGATKVRSVMSGSSTGWSTKYFYLKETDFGTGKTSNTFTLRFTSGSVTKDFTVYGSHNKPSASIWFLDSVVRSDSSDSAYCSVSNDGSIVAYEWTGSTGVLNTTSSQWVTVNPTNFSAPTADKSYSFRCRGKDSAGVWSNWSATSSIRFNAIPVTNVTTSNTIVNADGSSKATLTCNPTVTGSVSSYTWSNSATTNQTTSAIKSLTYPSGNTTSSYSCYVTDNDGHTSASTSVTITHNSRPVANAGADARINNGQPVSLTCSGSDTGAIHAYEWWNGVGSARLSTAQVYSTSTPGTYQCRAKDNNGFWSAPDYVNVVLNHPPTAVIDSPSGDLNAILINTLKGSGSYDNPADPVSVRSIKSHLWEVVSGPSITYKDGTNSNSADINFTVNQPLTTNVITFKLTVTDSEGEVNSTKKTLLINSYPTLDAFLKGEYVIHETVPNLATTNELIYLNNPDDPDLHFTGFTESLKVNYQLNHLSGENGTVNVNYDPNDYTGPLSITTGDFVNEGIYELVATLTDARGLTVVKKTNIKINPLPELSFLSPSSLVHEMSVGNLAISQPTDSNGTVQQISWRAQKNGIPMLDEYYAPDNLSARFQTDDIAQRNTITFTVSLIDDLGGTVEYDHDVIINLLPNISLVVPYKVRPNGIYYVDGPQAVHLATGAWDDLTNNPAIENGTYDIDGHITDITWTLISNNSGGVQEQINTPDNLYYSLDGVVLDASKPSFNGYRTYIANLANPQEQYTWKVSITDNDGAVVEKNVAIYVNSAPQFTLKGSGISLRYNSKGYLEIKGLTDVDGTVTDINWSQVSGPFVVFSSPNTATTSFQTMSSILDGGSHTFVFRAEVTDDLGAITSKTISFDVGEVWNTCGDIKTNPDTPPGGDCHRDSTLNYGVINNDTCPTLVNNLWIPGTLDSPAERSSLLTDCTDRHEFECKSCIPLPIADKYDSCQLLPYMLPPKMQSYGVNASGAIVETSSAPLNSNYGDPINTGEWNPNSQKDLWGATTDAEYEAIFKNKAQYPASRCLDVTDHRIWTNNDPSTGLSFTDAPDVDPSSQVDYLQTQACWEWDLMYQCIEPPINTCADWEDANKQPGNVEAAPANWHLLGLTDVTVDNYLYSLYLNKPGVTMEPNSNGKIPNNAILNAVYHFKTAERWQIECRNESTGAYSREISETFCEKNADGSANLLRCSPSNTKDIVNLGAMPLDVNNQPVDPAVGPDFSCPLLNLKPAECQYGYIQSLMDQLANLQHYQYSESSAVTYAKGSLQALPQCSEDPNNNGGLIFDIMDDRTSIAPTYIPNSADWDNPATAEGDECWHWQSKWLFYSGSQFQWCTLNCSDGSTGVQQELVGCGLIDQSATPVPEWEQWGPGWSQCVEPIIRTTCPADATVDITKNGAPATQAEIDALTCSDPLGTQNLTKTGSLVSSDLAYMCTDPNAPIITCLPDPNCTLDSVQSITSVNGLMTEQQQNYICEKQRNVCEKLVQVNECRPPEEFILNEDPSSFAKAAQLSQIVDGAIGNTSFENGELKLFAGMSTKCTYWTAEAVALYDIISATITGASAYFTGGTGAYIIGGMGAGDLLGSQEFLNQTRKCCNSNPTIVEKKVSVNSISTQVINEFMGGEQQSKVPVCNGSEIQLAYARSMDAINGQIIKGVSPGGYYYEGAAFIKKPFGGTSPGSFNSMKIPNPLNPFDTVTLIKGQKWCAFDNIVARIIQVGAREQLKDLAVASAIDGNFGATKKNITFSYVGSSNINYGWKQVDVINKNKIYAYQWSPDCFTATGQEKAQKGDLLCPANTDLVWTAFCSSDTCSDTPLVGANPATPQDDLNPRVGILDKWDIQSININDNGVFALTQFLVKKGVCDDVAHECNWDIFAWPAGGAATSISYDIAHKVYSDPADFKGSVPGYASTAAGWSPEFDVKKFKFQFLSLEPGEAWPTMMKGSVKDGGSATAIGTEFNFPMSIDTVSGFDIPSTNAKLYGGCNEKTLICDYSIQVPVTVTAIPEDDCRGLTMDEMMLVDFTQIDFGEYEKALTAKVEKTIIDPAKMTQLAGIAVENFAADMENGASVKGEDGIEIGKFGSTNFVGPRIDMFRFEQRLPFDKGFADEIDIDWGDSTSDTNLNFYSMRDEWQTRFNVAESNHNSICIPRFDTYIQDRDAALINKDAKWDAFLTCINNGNVGPVYTTADLTNMSISQCSNEYTIYKTAQDGYDKYTCGEIMDRWHDLQLCINSTGNGPVVTEQDLTNNPSLISSSNCGAENDAWVLAKQNNNVKACGMTGLTETQVYNACAGNFIFKRQSYQDYLSHFQGMIDSGEQVIEFEHFWPTYSSATDDGFREHTVTVTARVFTVPGDTNSGVVSEEIYTGLVRNWEGNMGSPNGTYHVTAIPPGQNRSISDPTLNSSYSGNEAPNPHPVGAASTINK